MCRLKEDLDRKEWLKRTYSLDDLEAWELLAKIEKCSS